MFNRSWEWFKLTVKPLWSNGTRRKRSGFGLRPWVECLEERCTPSIVGNANFTSTPNGADFNYAITLHNTGTTNIGTFWFAWIPGQDYMANNPISVANPAGWGSTVTGGYSGDGYAILWFNNGGAAITPGNSLNFNFTSAETPSQLGGNSQFFSNPPEGTSFVYIGAPETDPGYEFVVRAATTTTLIDNGPNPSTFGQAVSFTTTVSGGAAINGETVTIEDADNANAVVASPTLSSGTVTFSISGLSVGTHHLFAVYPGDSAHAASNSSASPVTQVVNPPVPDLTVSMSHVGLFHPGDSADIYTVSVHNISTAPTDGSTVTVTDTLPTGLLPTAADNGTINGWTVSFSGQTITATRTDILQGGASYPDLTVTVSVANNIASSVINTATVAGGGETNSGNDTASDPTATTPLADLTIGENHIGSFHQGDAADKYTLTVHNIGTGPTVGTVSISDTLPAGLSPTAADHGIINGWIVVYVGQTITASRSNVLAGGANYPVLTLTVSVGDHAPLLVTNSARVSGGGEINTNNDEVFDVTAILVHTQIRRRRGA
jgi:uncharacterized repeat protein (TIGR01451 family)